MNFFCLKAIVEIFAFKVGVGPKWPMHYLSGLRVLTLIRVACQLTLQAGLMYFKIKLVEVGGGAALFTTKMLNFES